MIDADTPALRAFFMLQSGLPRQGPGSDATTRRLLALVAGLPANPRVLDLGCGPGRASLVLAADTGGKVTAVDIHQPFLDTLDRAAARHGLASSIQTVNCSMDRLPYEDRSFDLVWAEGSAYIIGFDVALRLWRRLVAPGGTIVVTECEWTTDRPTARAREFWDAAYPLRTTAQNTAIAQDAGYDVLATLPLPASDWFDEYYDPLADRIAGADPTVPGMAEALEAARTEIQLRRDHGDEYGYTGYVLEPSP